MATLERRSIVLDTADIKHLRGIQTPEKRVEMMKYMQREDFVSTQLGAKASSLQLDCWCSWHWAVAPENAIHPSRRVLPNPLLVLFARLHNKVVGSSAVFVHRNEFRR